jgi:NTE family protein
MDISVSGGGLIEGERLMNFFHQQMSDIPIEGLPKAFAAVATDLASGREVWLEEGSLLEAVRASFALPGVFKPMKLGDQWLVDGGLVNPVPVSLCRAMGARVVIAVNLNGRLIGRHLRHRKVNPETLENRDKPELFDRLSNQIRTRATNLMGRALGGVKDAPSLFEVTASAINIMQDRITRSRMAGDPPDVILAPRLAHLGLMEYGRGKEAIAEGRACVMRMRPELEDALWEAT